MIRSSLVVIEPEALLVKVPELQVTVMADKPLIAAFKVTFEPVEVKVNELDEFGEATALETVMEPAVCKVALAEFI
jgi:hypothetical protein